MDAIVYNDLRVSPNGQYLFVDAEVAAYDYYNGMYVEAIVIDTEETYTGTGPSSRPVFKKEFSTEDKHQAMVLEAKDFGWSDFHGHLLYIYALAGGTPAPDTPCDWDGESSLGVVLWWQPIYEQGIKYMAKTVRECCDTNSGYIDYLLRYHTFMLALKSANYVLANDLFKRWFSSSEIVVRTTSCNCN